MSDDSYELFIREKDETGHEQGLYSVHQGAIHRNRLSSKTESNGIKSKSIRFLKNVFLPAGYPFSVSPDYLRYQIFNALQSFCSALAGLIASRAVLQGHGVGTAGASATDALLLTILQDAFSRITTILSAYYLGTSLFPEAKTYRFLADILNDAAFVLDSISPLLSSVSFGLTYSIYFPFLRFSLDSRPGPLRGIALCLSGMLRALCGFAAGGSKAALTMHFAQPANGSRQGDIGDLSAKDGSKETVLALVGMLCGFAVMPHLHNTYATNGLLFILITGHLLTNYIAVRAVALRSLNRQRAGILWSTYRVTEIDDKGTNARIMTPGEVASEEFLFTCPSAIFYPSSSDTKRIAGYCSIGSSLSSILPSTQSRPNLFPWITLEEKRWILTQDATRFRKVLELFKNEKYVLWLDPHLRKNHPHVHVILKEGHGPLDHLKAWLHASELLAHLGPLRGPSNTLDLMKNVQDSKQAVEVEFSSFVEKSRDAGWNIDENGYGLVAGSPRTVTIDEREYRKDK